MTRKLKIVVMTLESHIRQFSPQQYVFAPQRLTETIDALLKSHKKFMIFILKIKFNVQNFIWETKVKE